jgi:hypothetical protein
VLKIEKAYVWNGALTRVSVYGWVVPNLMRVCIARAVIAGKPSDPAAVPIVQIGSRIKEDFFCFFLGNILRPNDSRDSTER